MSAILWGYQLVQQKIIDLLKADANLLEPTKIKKYYFGPPSLLTLYPLVYVEFVGGPINPSSVKKELHTFDFDVIVADRHPSEDASEKTVEDFAEYIQKVIRANPTLGGLVDDAHDIESVRGVLRQDDYSLHATRIRVKCLKNT